MESLKISFKKILSYFRPLSRWGTTKQKGVILPTSMVGPVSGARTLSPRKEPCPWTQESEFHPMSAIYTNFMLAIYTNFSEPLVFFSLKPDWKISTHKIIMILHSFRRMPEESKTSQNSKSKKVSLCLKPAVEQAHFWLVEVWRHKPWIYSACINILLFCCF